MGAAQRTGEINRGRNSDSPDDCDLKNADLRARGDRGADAAATEKDENECSEKFADCPFWDRRCAPFRFPRLTCGGGSGRVALIVSLILASSSI